MQTMSVKYANILCIINIPRQKLIEEFTIKPCRICWNKKIAKWSKEKDLRYDGDS